MDSSTMGKKRNHDAGRIWAGVADITPDGLFQAVTELAEIFWPGIGDEWTYSNYRAVWTEPGAYLTVYADRRKTDGSGASLTPVDVAIMTVSERTDDCYLEVFYSYDQGIALAIVAMLHKRYGATELPTTGDQGQEVMPDQERQPWGAEAWYRKFTLEERGRYDNLRPLKEAWERGEITDAQIAEQFTKTADTIRGWRRNLRKKGAPDMNWKKA